MTESANVPAEEENQEKMKRLAVSMGLTKTHIKLAVPIKNADWAEKFCNGSTRAAATEHLINAGKTIL